MESNIDAMEWKLEVERVMHQLKVTVRSDSRVIIIYFIMHDFFNTNNFYNFKGKKFKYIISLYIIL